jgi:hypothetical protein
MTPWMFDVKFTCGTQLTFGSLTFTNGEDRDLKMLPPGLAPEHLALASSSASGGSCSGSDPCAGSYIRITKIVRGIPVITSILRPLARASSSSSSASTPYPDSSDDYPEIGASVCREPVEGGALSAWLIRMVTSHTIAPVVSHHQEIRSIQCSNTERWLGLEFESRLQCCSGPSDYGDHSAYCREVGWHSPEGTFHR